MFCTYGYIRESGENQAASGLGEEAQRVAVQRYYEASIAPRGVEWARFFQDLAVSASKRMFARRPEARELLRVVRPGDHIVTAFSSRAFRNTRDCLNTEAILTQMGVTLHCLDINWDTSTPTGRAMRQMMAVVDELSSGMTSDRNRAVAEVLKSQGRRAGGPGGKKVPLAKPYGYHLQPDNYLVPDNAERRVLEYMVLRHCVDRTWDREGIAREIHNLAEKGVLEVCRAWNGNKIRAAIAAFWRIVGSEGVEWIRDLRVKDYAVRTSADGRSR